MRKRRIGLGLVLAFAVLAAGTSPVGAGARDVESRFTGGANDDQTFVCPERPTAARAALRERRVPLDLSGGAVSGALAGTGLGPRVARVSRVASVGAAWAADIVPFAFRSPRGPPVAGS